MKYMLKILMSLLFINNINANDYLFEVYAISKLSTIEISDDFKFSAYTSEGMWDDSNGIMEMKNVLVILNNKTKK